MGEFSFINLRKSLPTCALVDGPLPLRMEEKTSARPRNRTFGVDSVTRRGLFRWYDALSKWAPLDNFPNPRHASNFRPVAICVTAVLGGISPIYLPTLPRTHMRRTFLRPLFGRYTSARAKRSLSSPWREFRLMSELPNFRRRADPGGISDLRYTATDLRILYGCHFRYVGGGGAFPLEI